MKQNDGKPLSEQESEAAEGAPDHGDDAGADGPERACLVECLLLRGKGCDVGRRKPQIGQNSEKSQHVPEKGDGDGDAEPEGLSLHGRNSSAVSGLARR